MAELKTYNGALIATDDNKISTACSCAYHCDDCDYTVHISTPLVPSDVLYYNGGCFWEGGTTAYPARTYELNCTDNQWVLNIYDGRPKQGEPIATHIKEPSRCPEGTYSGGAVIS